MSLRQRAGIMAVLGAVALAAYGTARYYRHSLVIWVVEQSLLQKAPAGTNPAVLTRRFRALFAALPNRDARFARALAISQEIEKLQILTPQELEHLLSITPASSSRQSP